MIPSDQLPGYIVNVNQFNKEKAWKTKVDSWCKEVNQLCNLLGIKTLIKKDEHDYIFQIAVPDLSAQVKTFKDVDPERGDEIALFWEHNVNQEVAAMDAIVNASFRKLKGYKKGELKESLQFLACLAMRTISHLGRDQLKVKETYISFTHPDGSGTQQLVTEKLPAKKFREATHKFIMAFDKLKTSSSTAKKTYADEYKAAYLAAKELLASLPELEKRALKPSIDEAVKVLKYFHKKAKK